MKEIFTQRLKSLRIANGYSQRELARLLNVVQVSYLRWEQGKTEPDIDHICMMCEIFNVSADYLLGNVDEFDIKTPTNSLAQMLTKDETTLVGAYRKMTADKQRSLLSLLDLKS